MEIQQLKGFQAVAKYKNFTVAAQKTHRTQPTISLQIKALEDELGTKLFERLGPRKVTLTAEGKLLLELTGGILEQLESIRTRFDEERGEFNHSALKVVTHRSVMVCLLPRVIQRFKEKFPECRLSILNRDRTEIISMLNDNEADFGISSLTTVPSNMEYRVFSRFNRILIGTKKHPISSKSNVTLEDVASYPLILPTKESITRKIIDRLFEAKGLQYNLTMEVVGRDAIKTYVGMNLGLSIINEYYITPEDRSKLFVKDLSRILGKAETGIVVRKGKYLSAPAREFADLLVKENSGQ